MVSNHGRIGLLIFFSHPVGAMMDLISGPELYERARLLNNVSEV